jgi:hypothetical protein
MNVGIERILFTSFVGFLIIAALWVAKDWPIRASIIILLLGGIGTILTIVQLTLDIKAVCGKDLKVVRPTFDTQAIEHEGRWGSLEIWAWLWGLFFAIHLIGFPIALPLFVFLYIKLYGGGWPTAVILTAVTWGFLYGIYDYLLNVPWPKPWLGFLLSRF